MLYDLVADGENVACNTCHIHCSGCISSTQYIHTKAGYIHRRIGFQYHMNRHTFAHNPTQDMQPKPFAKAFLFLLLIQRPLLAQPYAWVPSRNLSSFSRKADYQTTMKKNATHLLPFLLVGGSSRNRDEVAKLSCLLEPSWKAACPMLFLPASLHADRGFAKSRNI